MKRSAAGAAAVLFLLFSSCATNHLPVPGESAAVKKTVSIEYMAIADAYNDLAKYDKAAQYYLLAMIVQKVFQTCAGDNNCLSGLRCLYLADIQRIVVQAADLLGHQAGHGDGGPGAQPGGELPDGQGGRGDPAVPS